MTLVAHIRTLDAVCVEKLELARTSQISADIFGKLADVIEFSKYVQRHLARLLNSRNDFDNFMETTEMSGIIVAHNGVTHFYSTTWFFDKVILIIIQLFIKTLRVENSTSGASRAAEMSTTIAMCQILYIDIFFLSFADVYFFITY